RTRAGRRCRGGVAWVGSGVGGGADLAAARARAGTRSAGSTGPGDELRAWRDEPPAPRPPADLECADEPASRARAADGALATLPALAGADRTGVLGGRVHDPRGRQHPGRADGCPAGRACVAGLATRAVGRQQRAGVAAVAARAAGAVQPLPAARRHLAPAAPGLRPRERGLVDA